MAGTNPSPDSPAEDTGLIQKIADGDTRALAALYDRYSSLLFSLARRILRDHQASEEILQEVFLQVWNQAGRYDTERSSVSTWLVLLTRSRSIDRLRSRQSRDRTRNSLEAQKPPSHTSARAWGNVLQEQRRVRLTAALGDLPLEQRQVIEAAFYQGMSQSEIAEVENIPLGTVKTRTLLAMKKLRKALGEDLGELL